MKNSLNPSDEGMIGPKRCLITCFNTITSMSVDVRKRLFLIFLTSLNEIWWCIHNKAKISWKREGVPWCYYMDIGYTFCSGTLKKIGVLGHRNFSGLSNFWWNVGKSEIFVHDSWKNLNLCQKGGTTTLINSPYCVEPIPHSHQCSCYSCYLHLFLLRCFPSNPYSSVLEQIAGGHLAKKDRPKWTTSGMDVSSITIKCINLSFPDIWCTFMWNCWGRE